MNATPPSPIPSFFHFGLIVTGKSEELHLPELFSSLTATGLCAFRVITRIAQRSPITSPQKTARMVGSGKIIPDKDVEKIGLPARHFLNNGNAHYVIVVDDLEYARREIVQTVYARYRATLDNLLTPEQRPRSAVHFLVYMIEAYYFADANAINTVLLLNLEDYAEDVEAIPYPDGKLKQIYQGFHKVEHGGKILEHLNVEHVLSRPDTCASLRTLFAWCAKVLAQSPYCDADSLVDKYRLTDGNLSETTRSQ